MIDVEKIIDEIIKLKDNEKLDVKKLAKKLYIETSNKIDGDVCMLIDVLNSLCNLNLVKIDYEYIKRYNPVVKLYSSMEEVIKDLNFLRKVARQNYSYALGCDIVPYKLSNPISIRDKRQMVSKSIHCSSFIATNGRVGPATHILVGKGIYSMFEEIGYINIDYPEIILSKEIDDYEVMCIRLFDESDKYISILEGKYQLCGFIAETSEEVVSLTIEDVMVEKNTFKKGLVEKVKKFLG